MEKPLSPAELAAVRQALSRHPRTGVRDVVAFELVCNGVRVSEMPQLSMPADVTVADGARALSLDVSVMKTDPESTWRLALVGAAREALVRLRAEREAHEGPLPPGAPLFAETGPFAAPSRSGFHRRLAAAAATAGIGRPIGAHSLRRSMLTSAFAAGTLLADLAKWSRRRELHWVYRYLGGML